MKKTSVRQGAQSASCEPINEQEDFRKKSQGLLQGGDKNPGQEKEINKADFTRGYKPDEPCYYISISFRAVGASAWQQSNLGEYEQLSLWKSIPTHSSSSDTTSQESPSTQTSLATNQNQENLTSLQWVSPAREQATQELGQDSNTQLHLFGEKDLDALLKLNPSSVLWNSLKELSDEDLELFLPPSIWQDTVLKLKQSRQQALALDNRGTDCLSFPTLTSNSNSTSRPAGQTKCDRWFKDNGLIAPGYQLSAQAMALIMGFPMDWFDCLSPVKPQEESEPDTSQDEQLLQDKQQLPSVESSISIPCLVKQPKQPEVKGIIKQDLGHCPSGNRFANRFTVYIPDSDSTITVSKLFVYPDFSESDEQINKCKSKNRHETNSIVSDGSSNCSSKTNSPSTKCSSKTRRKKGEGSGAIFYRTVTRNGRDYQQAYYQWRENGKQRTKYIPKKLLDKVKQAESRKMPDEDILV